MNNRILSLDVAAKIQLDLKSINAQQILVLGLKGSGKSNTTAVIAEELLEGGFPITIIDVESEYYTLKERYQLVVVGSSPHVDFEVDFTSGRDLANWVFDNNVSVVLDVLRYSDEEREHFLEEYLKQFWLRIEILSKPHFILIDEAHEFIPQGKKTPLKLLITRLCLRGRKRGLGMLIATQRPANVEKNIITQSSLMFLHRNTYPTDLKVYGELLPKSTAEIKEQVPKMGAGQVIAMVNYQFVTATIRERYTYHAGQTPSLDAGDPTTTPSDLKPIPDELLASLKQQVGEARPNQTIPLEAVLAENATLKEQVTTLQAQVKALEELLANGQPAAEKSDDFIQQVRKAQLKKFELELKRLRTKTPDLHKRMLAVLMAHSNDRLSLMEIAGKLGIAHTTAENNPPLGLMGFITRTKGAHGKYIYQSAVEQWISTHFKDLDCSELRGRIFEVMREGMPS